MRGWFYGIGGIVALSVFIVAWIGYRTEKSVDEMMRSDTIESVGYASSHLNATYEIDGTEVPLVNGEATLQSGGTVRVAGEPVNADLNDDGVEDRIILLETSAASEQTARWYLATALSYERGYFGSNAIPLGQETYRVHELYDTISVSSDETDARPVESPMVATSTDVIAKTRYFYVFGTTLSEFGPFAGEDVSTMFGHYSMTEDSRTFRECAGHEYVVSEDSHALAAMDAIYRERNHTGGGGSVFMMLASSLNASTDTEGTENDLLVHAVLSAPQDGVCGDQQEREVRGDDIPDQQPSATTTTSQGE